MAEQRHNVLKDHAYDGIQEYDNPMPGWWVWGFILTIIFAFPYWAWYHMTDGHGIYAELEADMARAAELAPKLEEGREAMLAYLDDAAILERGAKVFAGTCAACHMVDGGGSVGPNLTDDRWKNVNAIEDLVGIVRDGVPGTAMVPNGPTMSQQDIVSVAAYSATLMGTTPAVAKDAEGDIVLSSWQ